MSRAIPRRNRLAIIAGNKDADSSMREAVSLGVFDKSRKIIKKDGQVEIPVMQSVPGYEHILQEDPVYYRKTPDLCHSLQGKIPQECIDILPRGWFLLGDIIVVKIHPGLREYEQQIGQALLDFYPRCRSVLADEGISGPFREPARRLIIGDKTQTVHRENGIRFNLDARLVMFSPGNLTERIRMSRLGKGEYVVDMFAGIGYFSIPMAVHSQPRKIMAIEWNPNAYHYLCQNIRQNHVEDIVQPVLGDCAKVTPEGAADRVVMGMVQVTDRYLQKGISALRPGGILHYHQTIPSRMYPDAAIRDVTAAAEALGYHADILGHVLVKKFSPGVVHAVVDARIDSDF
ncbi:MAG: class I SAM-dependent methyltransferase family protein [Methanothrix sp.]|nr:class I SAM-dependent methyltransferase family protein [Methanothrix sp.]